MKGKGPTQKTKSQCEKKPTTASVRNVSTPSPIQMTSRSATKIKQPGTVPSCCGCGIVVTDDTKALQCDRCMSNEIWKCAECLNLTGEMYDHLVSDCSPVLRWFCGGCEKIVMSTNHGTGQQNEKIDNLISLIEKLVEKYESIESKLEEKCSVDDAKQLDLRIRQIEDRVSKLDNECQTKMQSLECQVQSAAATSVPWKDNGPTDEELIKHAVKEEITRKTVEEKDLESRKRNIILYRIPEKKTESVSDRKQNDMIFVKDLLDCVFNMELENSDIEKFYRLGHWEEDKARPLLIAFKNCEKKDHIMANLRNLKQQVDKFRGIGISHDLPPQERDEIKKMVEEAKKAHGDLGTDTAENYKFIVVGHGPRRKVIKIKKTISSARM